MAILPTGIYRAIESRLRKRECMVSDAEIALRHARADAYSLNGGKWTELSVAAARAPGVDPTAIRSSVSEGSLTERAAEAVLRAETEVAIAQRWHHVFAMTDDYFFDKPEKKIIRMIYSEGNTSQRVAEIFGVDRQTVRRARDTYITFCALLAAEQGLLKSCDGIETR